MKDDNKMLRAVFSNMPISFLSELKKYRTKNSLVRVQYRGRSGRRDSGGSVSLKNAKKFTLYIHGRENDSNYMLRDKHFEILSKSLKGERDQISDLESEIKSLHLSCNRYEKALKEKMDSIQSIHDGYSRQLKDKREIYENLQRVHKEVVEGLQTTLKQYQQNTSDRITSHKKEISDLTNAVKTISKYI